QLCDGRQRSRRTVEELAKSERRGQGDIRLEAWRRIRVSAATRRAGCVGSYVSFALDRLAAKHGSRPAVQGTRRGPSRHDRRECDGWVVIEAGREDSRRRPACVSAVPSGHRRRPAAIEGYPRHARGAVGTLGQVHQPKHAATQLSGGWRASSGGSSGRRIPKGGVWATINLYANISSSY